MSSEESIVYENENIEGLLYTSQGESSSDEISSGQWTPVPKLSFVEKESRWDKSLYSSGNGDVCNDYISKSNSTIIKHPYLNYPAVTDPGIQVALLGSEPTITYPDDGQELYLHLCSEMNVCPVRMFHDNLLNPVNSVSYYGVNPKGVRAMALALQNNKTVICFNMTDNFLNDDACYHLGQMLKYNTTLQELILDGCRIGASGMLPLGANLIFNQTLVTLDLARNELGDAGGVVLANQLANGTRIKKVNLSKNKLGRQTAIALPDVLQWNPVTHIDLSWNDFSDVPSTVKMLDILATSEFIEELNLSFNSFEDDRVADAINNILNIPTLKVLDLSNNRFKGTAINNFIPGLVNAKNLVTFNLSYNPMTPADAYNILRNMLNPQVNLQELLMENVSVHKSFLKLLAHITSKKGRKSFVVTYGHVLQNWTIKRADLRTLLLKRADYLGKSDKIHHIDILLYFLCLNKEWPKPVTTKTLLERLNNENIPLTEDFIQELSIAFAGPETKKLPTVDFSLITEYIKRLWPDKTLPATPPPEINQVSEPENSTITKVMKAKGKF